MRADKDKNMSELRQNIISKDWVIVSTERAKRPHTFASKKEKIELPVMDEKCPFCPCNKEEIPFDTFRIGSIDDWKLRALPNKFGALSKEGAVEKGVDGIYRKVTGVGHHEVIIETPIHNTNLALMPIDDVAKVLLAYKERYNVISQDNRVECIIIFKNHGINAGASLAHPHSQLIALPVVPNHIRERSDNARQYYDDNLECVFCYELHEEMKAKDRIIMETEHFVSFIPYAAFSPFHTWIFPKRHDSSFGNINEGEIYDLALNLQTVLGKIYYGLHDPDYNYVIRSIAVNDGKVKYFHWYISLIPKVGQIAGFELGSGMHINTALPEESAKFLRELDIKSYL